MQLAPAYRDALADKSVFDVVRDHLGYRLELQRATFPRKCAAGETLPLSASVVNWGFAAPHNARPLQVVLVADGSTAPALVANARLRRRRSPLSDARFGRRGRRHGAPRAGDAVSRRSAS